MNFQDILATLPDVSHLRGLDIVDTTGQTVHHIPHAPGKTGSLRVYRALAQQFGGKLDAAAVEQGLQTAARTAIMTGDLVLGAAIAARSPCRPLRGACRR